jgi:ABC-type transport system involved in Fe-S cluster assembly fused permease/ATPase subunit
MSKKIILKNKQKKSSIKATDVTETLVEASIFDNEKIKEKERARRIELSHVVTSLRKAIKNYNKEITLFIVASRIASISDSNKIIVLDEGKIVGMGKHKQLLKDCEVYKEIAYSQLSKEEL